MIEIAFVGCGHIHTPNFVKLTNERNEFKVAAVWDHDVERGQKNAEELNSTFVANVQEIWSNNSITGVVICSETYLHKELIDSAVAAKKNLFVEKPLGFSCKEALENAKAITDAGVIFQTGYFMRSNPVNIFLKKQIEAGAFGKITRMRHSNCHAGALKGWFDTQWRWMADPKQSGCGGFGDLGTHSLDIMMWMLGTPQRVTGIIENATQRYGAECDEYGEAMLEYPNGIIGSISAGWVDVANPISLEIRGTAGHAIVNGNQLFFKSEHVEGATGETPWTDLPEAQPHAFVLYLDALVGKSVKLVSATEAADRNRVMSAIYQASATKSWVNI